MIQNSFLDNQQIDNENQQISEQIDITNNKVSLQNYRSFDKDQVLSEIDKYYQNHNSFKDIHKELLHISHKIQIPDEYLNHIIDYLQNENQEQAQILTYCKILRQSIMKGANIKIEKFIQIFGKIKNKDSISELIKILSIMQQQKQLKDENINEILNFNDLDVEIRQYLIKLKYIFNPQINRDSSNLQQYMLEDQKDFFNQAIVTMENHFDYQRIYDCGDYQQLAQITQNTDNCDANITDQVSKNVIEDLQIIQKKNQGPSTLLKSTYETVKQIYEYACQHRWIEQSDKDKYLPDRLFGSKYFSNGILGEFLCDRMIIETFLIISDKYNQYIQFYQLIFFYNHQMNKLLIKSINYVQILILLKCYSQQINLIAFMLIQSIEVRLKWKI